MRCYNCFGEYDEKYEICPHCGHEKITQQVQQHYLPYGTLLNDRFIIGKVLGAGGFGVTYAAWDEKLKIKVAIKEYMPGEFSTRNTGETKISMYGGDKAEFFIAGRDKFIEEAKKLAKFEQEAGIVQIYNSFEENDTAYIIMECLEGETLEARIKREGKIPADIAVQLMLPVLHSLQKVHDMEIIHRDISPSNIFITIKDEVKLIDFGAARLIPADRDESLTVLYKEGYTAEEQYIRNGNQGPWTDVYSCAATLYKAITGVSPDGALDRRKNDSIKKPSKLSSGVKKNIDIAIMNGLNLDFTKRTESVEKFANELTLKGDVEDRFEKKVEHKETIIPKWMKILVPTVGGMLFIFIILLLTGVIFGNIFAENNQLENNKTRVPNVVNQSENKAENEMTNAELYLQIMDKQYSSEIKKNIILSQAISAGNIIEKKSQIDAVMSGGIETVYMEEVRGDSKEKAVESLENTGFIVETKVVNSASEPGSVAAQDVAKDEGKDRGSEVTLSISKGLETINKNIEVTIPDIVGMTYEKIQVLFENLGIYVRLNTREISDIVPENECMIQDVQPGSKIKQGESVGIVLSSGPDMVRVVDVQYKEATIAKQILEDIKLKVIIKYEYSNTVMEGHVIRQSLETGFKVKAREEIVLYVSGGRVDEGLGFDVKIDETKKESQTKTNPETKVESETKTAVESETKIAVESETKTKVESEAGLVTESTTKFVESVQSNISDKIIIDFGNCGTLAKWKFDNEGTLTIYGSGAMEDYGDITVDYKYAIKHSPWYSYEDNINNVIIENGVTNIGNYAFYSFDSLASISIPGSITNIGRLAFGRCALKNIIIPNSITSIGSEAFSESRLNNILIPNSVTSIGDAAFSYCKSLTSITIPNSVTSIGVGSFFYCTSLTNITISNSVTSIANNAFALTNLTEVTINATCSLGITAFPSNCTIKYY